MLFFFLTQSLDKIVKNKLFSYENAQFVALSFLFNVQNISKKKNKKKEMKIFDLNMDTSVSRSNLCVIKILIKITRNM